MKNIRKQFPLFKTNNKLVYLDSAASTQTTQVALDALNEYYYDYRSNVHRGFYDISQKADKAYEASKASVANFIGALPEEIVFTSGATASLNMLARMLESEITDKQNIVLTEMEHHANLIPWQQVVKRTGCELRFIPVKDDYTLDYDIARELIDNNTKVVSFVHISNSLGTVNDIALLTKLANKVGAYSIIDACQSIAHIPTDVVTTDCDFLVASGHKMYGPTGIGFLFGKKENLDKLEPVVFGGDMIRSVDYKESTWADSPAKFEAGTPPIAQVIGLGAACEFILSNVETIEKEKELTAYLLTSLKEVGVEIIGSESVENRVGVVSFRIGDAHPHDVADILAKNNICVRAGHHCTMPLMKKLGLPGTVRVSIGIYNTKKDIDKLIVGLRKVRDTLQLSS